MNIDIKDDLKNMKMIFSVSIKKRKTVAEKKIFFTWQDVEKHVKENYTPPKGYSLGECLNSVIKADNDDRCKQTWEFVLTSSASTPTVKTKTVKKTLQKKTRDK
jgi:hypothetical protein|tara:strand:+ start:1368 stop:1679 length:312 start_codon:yes stop_codon:yes gene_type:complete